MDPQQSELILDHGVGAQPVVITLSQLTQAQTSHNGEQVTGVQTFQTLTPVTENLMNVENIPVTSGTSKTITSTDTLSNMLSGQQGFSINTGANNQAFIVLGGENNKNGSNRSGTEHGGMQILSLNNGQITDLTASPNGQMALSSESNEQPLYVNAKQYYRILKRREARAKLEAAGKITKERKKYLYESRHKHAKNRVRGIGGTFERQKKDKNDANIVNMSIAQLLT